MRHPTWTLLHVLLAGALQCSRAVRRSERASDDDQVTDVPRGAFQVVHQMVPRFCQLMYFAQYIAASDKKWFDDAIEEAYRKTPQAHTSRIEELDSIDVEQWPACKPGTPVIDCARTFRPVMWLQQVFNLGDVLKIHGSPWYCPWCKSKASDIDLQSVKARSNLFKEAVANAGFNIKGSESICAKDSIKDHDTTALRECMVVRAARLPLDYASQLDLLGLLNGWWYYKDSDKRQHLIRGNASEWQQTVQDWLSAPLSGGHFLINRRRAKLSMLGLGYDYTAEKASCRRLVDTAQETRVLERVEKEVVEACDEGQGCRERAGSYCPEGTRCACKRPYTPQRAVTAFNAVFWFVSPMTVAVLSGGFAAAAGGISSVPAAVWSAGWFPDYIPAVLAMALASRKWFPECMCFEMACQYDAALGACALQGRKNMSASSNPYSWLPMNGKKCTRSSGQEDKCEFQSCSKGDVQVKRGEHLFGRVGYVGADLYNCMNLNGDQESQLTFLDEWQDPSWRTVLNNTPAARAKMYGRHRPRSRHDLLLAPKH